MKILCNLTTKKIEAFSRWDDIVFNPETHVVLTVSDVPDMELDRLNDTNDGLRPITQAEIDADIEEEKTHTSDIDERFNQPLKAFSLVVLDEINLLRTHAGLQPRTITQLKNAVKSKL